VKKSLIYTAMLAAAAIMIWFASVLPKGDMAPVTGASVNVSPVNGAEGHYVLSNSGGVETAQWAAGPAPAATPVKATQPVADAAKPDAASEPPANKKTTTIGRGKAKICATTDIVFDTFREIRLPPTTVFKDSGRLIGDIRTASLDAGNDWKLAAFITTDSVVLTRQRPCAEVGARMLIAPLFNEPSASASEKHRWAIDAVLDYPIPANKPPIEIGKLIDDVSILGVLLTDVGDPLTPPKDKTDETTNAARCLTEAQKVAAHEKAIIERQTSMFVFMQHPAAAEMSFGCAEYSFKPYLYIAWDHQAKPPAATVKLIASAGEYLTGAASDELKQELAKCVTEALKPNSGELADRESRGVKIECQAFARDGGGGSATIYRRFGDSPIRPAVITGVNQPQTIEPKGLTSRSFFDHLAVVANLIVRCPIFEINERTLERYASVLGIDRAEIERRSGQFYMAILQSSEKMSIGRDKACASASSLYGPYGSSIPELLSPAPG
jgi:hypothetical protein